MTGLAERAVRSGTLDRLQCFGGFFQAKANRARKAGLQQQKLEDPIGIDSADIEPLVSFISPATPQDAGPAEVGHRKSGRIGHIAKQQVINIEDAKRLVGSFQKLAQLDELPA